MKVSIDDLEGQPQQRLLYSFKESLEGLDAVKPVVGDLTLSLGPWGVRVSGRVQTLLKLTCDRCLRPYFQSLNVEIDERLVYKSKDAQVPRERELSRDDFVEPIPEDGVLDISDIVYQAVTLAAPTYCLCGAECPGPPTAEESGKSLGQDKPERPAEDPRWKNLKTLFPSEGSGEKS